MNKTPAIKIANFLRDQALPEFACPISSFIFVKNNLLTVRYLKL